MNCKTFLALTKEHFWYVRPRRDNELTVQKKGEKDVLKQHGWRLLNKLRRKEIFKLVIEGLERVKRCISNGIGPYKFITVISKRN